MKLLNHLSLEFIEINDFGNKNHRLGCGIKLKATMFRSSLCNYSHAYIILQGTITIVGHIGDGTEP